MADRQQEVVRPLLVEVEPVVLGQELAMQLLPERITRLQLVLVVLLVGIMEMRLAGTPPQLGADQLLNPQVAAKVVTLLDLVLYLLGQMAGVVAALLHGILAQEQPLADQEIGLLHHHHKAMLEEALPALEALLLAAVVVLALQAGTLLVIQVVLAETDNLPRLAVLRQLTLAAVGEYPTQ